MEHGPWSRATCSALIDYTVIPHSQSKTVLFCRQARYQIQGILLSSVGTLASLTIAGKRSAGVLISP